MSFNFKAWEATPFESNTMVKAEQKNIAPEIDWEERLYEVAKGLYLRNNYVQPEFVIGKAEKFINALRRHTEEGRIPIPQRNRTIRSHMSYDTCLETLQANDLSKVNNIVLIHLSDGNSNAKEFAEGVRDATGKSVYVAEKNMTIEFNKTPF